MKTINEKLVEFAEFKGLTQYKFCKESGISDGALRGSRSVGVESLAKIKEKYPQLNLDWIMFNKGPMLLGGDVLKEPSALYEPPRTIDDIVDQRIEKKLEDVKEMLTELIRADINKEIEDTLRDLKKDDSK
tara:strand:- start:1013 stop:1405 length:393 start_codon:yes stop_codon:yes gene_type:complete